jgi:hypothetical protein
VFRVSNFKKQISPQRHRDAEKPDSGVHHCSNPTPHQSNSEVACDAKLPLPQSALIWQSTCAASEKLLLQVHQVHLLTVFKQIDHELVVFCKFMKFIKFIWVSASCNGAVDINK